MTKHIPALELRSAFPLETRDDDPLAAATRAIEELRGNVETFRTDAEKRFEDQIKAVTTRLDGIETRAARPGNQKSRDDQHEIENRAFTNFLRRGRESLTDVEVRTLRVSDDTAGGYLAPPEFSLEVDKNIVQFSPVRQAARLGTTASGSVKIPRRTGQPTAVWTGETQPRTPTGSTYGQVEITVQEIACYVDVSNKLLEDSAVDVAAEVAFDLAEEFGRAEGNAFVLGDSINKPMGILVDGGVAYTAGGVAAALIDSTHNGADALTDLYYALKPFYRQRGIWMANGSSLAAIRKLKDAQGRYLWEPAISQGQPETILGRPVVEAVDCPDIAANSFPVIFGDFASGYRIYDRVNGLGLLRDPYSQATSGLTRFHARKRVGGGVVRGEALRKLKIAAA